MTALLRRAVTPETNEAVAWLEREYDTVPFSSRRVREAAVDLGVASARAMVALIDDLAFCWQQFEYRETCWAGATPGEH